MIFRKTNNGRQIESKEGVSIYGSFDISLDYSANNKELLIFDKDGNKVGEGFIKMIEPEPPKPISLEVLNARGDMCESCIFKKELIRTKGIIDVYTVKCSSCQNCSGNISLKNGRCPELRWK